jgi:hypothetical protein
MQHHRPTGTLRNSPSETTTWPLFMIFRQYEIKDETEIDFPTVHWTEKEYHLSCP